MKTTEQQWLRAVPRGLNTTDEIHIWRAFLDLSSFETEYLFGNLSADEIERANRFRFEKDKNRFIVARGILRRILGGYLGKDPHKIRFEYTSYNKPFLATKSDNIHFNLSHSEAFALYAITPRQNIGIDIEYIRHDVAVLEIASRFFSQNEISSLDKISEDKQHNVFFQFWTRKESFLKAKGEGISFPMEKVDVSFINGKGLSHVTLLDEEKESMRWYVQDLFPGPGYVAAIAVEGSNHNLSCFDYANEAQ